MNSQSIRVLLVADTHLGFDLPFRPRIERRRRGHDFFANFKAALEPALRREVDIVVHGGDLLYRSKVPPALVEMAMDPLITVADRGVPVYLVPGNHERSRIPLQLWSNHKDINIFDKPRTFKCTLNGITIALSGFPFARKIRDSFRELVQQTGYKETPADVSLLCMHQTVEGAQVGTVNYTFRSGPDVIRGTDIPGDFRYIVCGHIHRAQVLTQDLSGRSLASLVVYPGSIERTSFAERNEDKGYMMLDINPNGGAGQGAEVSFVTLPTRPMVVLDLRQRDLSGQSLEQHLRRRVAELDREAVVSVRLDGSEDWIAKNGLSAKGLRELAPPSMNISLASSFRSKRSNPKRSTV